jgi:hypothetical protein
MCSCIKQVAKNSFSTSGCSPFLTCDAFSEGSCGRSKNFQWLLHIIKFLMSLYLLLLRLQGFQKECCHGICQGEMSLKALSK